MEKLKSKQNNKRCIMESDFDILPEKIKKHLDEVTKESGLPYKEESVKLITTNWLEKKKMFEDQIKSLDMIEVESFNKDDDRGALLLTYSGSLISLGTLIDKSRHVEYSSIKLRSDVPDIVIMEKTNVSDNLLLDEGVSFTEGKIKSTSNLLKIAVCREDVSIEEQDKRIREATIFLTNSFVYLNRSLSMDGESLPEQFTMKAMIKYVASMNGITQKAAKTIIEDFLYMVECGALLGERVPIGRIGKLFIKKRAAQKARVGINPATGEQITISAKPEMFVPKVGFSKSLKEKAAQVNIKE
jgi:nucleoid DNA-binding protein